MTLIPIVWRKNEKPESTGLEAVDFTIEKEIFLEFVTGL